MNIFKNPRVQICAVTKGRSIQEVEALLKKHPQIKIIGENRWPDCQEKFDHFGNTKMFPKLEKHFIGPLQSNKINKIVPLVDVIQSVDSAKLIEKIDQAAGALGKKIKFCIQVNVSEEPQKHGISKEQLDNLIEFYLSKNFKNLELIGLMTIGEQTSLEERRKYFAEFKKFFDEANEKHFSENISAKNSNISSEIPKNSPKKPNTSPKTSPKIPINNQPSFSEPSTHPALSVLSMGMSEDYEIAIKEGATMVRLGRALFEDIAQKV